MLAQLRVSKSPGSGRHTVALDTPRQSSHSALGAVTVTGGQVVSWGLIHKLYVCHADVSSYMSSAHASQGPQPRSQLRARSECLPRATPLLTPTRPVEFQIMSGHVRWYRNRQRQRFCSGVRSSFPMAAYVNTSVPSRSLRQATTSGTASVKHSQHGMPHLLCVTTQHTYAKQSARSKP